MRHAALGAIVTLGALQGLLVPAALADEACGGQDAPCHVTDGDYHYLQPAVPPGPGGYPVLVHLHGWASSGKSALANATVTGPVLQRGYVFIAPNALRRPESGKRDWAVRDGQPFTRRDEIAFLASVIDDLGSRLPLDRSRLLLAGFSRGGSMVWDVACRAPEAFTAYAPVAGGFWDPLPATCAGPVRLFHTHGWGDAVVPLEGRLLGTSGLAQGDIFAGLKIWRDTNLCASRPAEKRLAEGDRLLRAWETCAPDSEVRLVLHPGGHAIPEGWATAALDWFETGTKPSDRIAGQR